MNNLTSVYASTSPSTWDPSGQPFKPACPDTGLGMGCTLSTDGIDLLNLKMQPQSAAPSPSPTATTWGWVPGVAVVVGVVMLAGAARWRRNPTYRRNIDAFTDTEGRIRPIRGSSGYDDDVEAIDREEREREAQAERYRGVERGRESIQRPPWAHGMSQERIQQIASDAGRSPYEEHWWQGARLYPGTGEYKALVLEAGAARKHAAVEHHGRSHAPRSRAERIAQRTESRRVIQRAGEDLPW